MSGRIIETGADVAEGAAWLAAQDRRFAAALEQTGPLPLRRRPEGFAQLFWVIVGQQVSTASAAAIWKRIEAAGFSDQEAVASAQPDRLRALGLSRQKAGYALALARAGIDYDALRDLPDEAVVARLIEVPGVGRWTAEIYAMFSLGRADVFASGDLALQEATRILFERPARPRAAEMHRLAARWSPWRGVAARLLWAYYRVATKREGIR